MTQIEELLRFLGEGAARLRLLAERAEVDVQAFVMRADFGLRQHDWPHHRDRDRDCHHGPGRANVGDALDS